ncbi:MAG TPA: hypothetical protein VNW92_23695, partial [Polyangiaceae bacterium]|nr:hypothetical protein [Polyangiaceae bacterium]
MKNKTGRRGALELCSKLATVTCMGAMLVACDPTTPAGGGGGAAGVGGASGTGGASGASGASGGVGTGGIYRFAPFRTNLIDVTAASGGTGAAGGSGGSGNTAGVGGVGGVGASGSGGTGGVLALCIPSAPGGSPPASAVCGDGFRAASEDCDDANTSNADSCSSSCKVTPELVDPRVASMSVLPLPSRSLGSSRHPMAAGCNAVGVSFVDQTSDPPALELSTYSSSGVPASTFRYGTSTVDFPDPAVAALPGDAFALAWT